MADRTRAWSSTSSTRIGSSASTAPLSPAQRHRQLDPAATLRLRCYRQLRTDDGRALPHALEPETGRNALRMESAAVVGDGDAQVVIGPDDDAHHGGVGMLADVGERLLHDADELGLRPRPDLR